MPARLSELLDKNITGGHTSFLFSLLFFYGLLYTHSWYFFSKIGNTFSSRLPNGLDAKNVSLASERPESCLTCQGIMHRPLRPPARGAAAPPLLLLFTVGLGVIYVEAACDLACACRSQPQRPALRQPRFAFTGRV